MNTHRRILGWSFLVIGGMNALGMTIMTFQHFEVFSGAPWEIYLLNFVVVSICFMSSVCGFFLLKERRWAFNTLFKLSFLWLLFFPLGTVLALYYFYFHFKYRRKAAL
ncbi:hypothetical protein ABT58_17165 [Photobacterium aphoticum]|uniref:Uncharacterized protein n=1 Tax=Photobacterium aphoticum TaxID=754436 RepID=A0A0J1GIM0_9GAMM|nr:hypothetical protein ABT58_17165 [Photobacterium aphoticum]